MQPARHFNPMIDLHIAKKPLFGLYAPSNRGAGRGRGGSPPVDAPPPKTPSQLAAEALAYRAAEFIFAGSMEGCFARGYTSSSELAKGSAEHGDVDKTPYPHLIHPLAVKTHKIAEN